MKLGPRIKELRELRGLSQAKLAKKLDKSQPSISRWEKSVNNPSYGLLPQLAKELNCTTGDILAPLGIPPAGKAKRRRAA